MSVFEKEVKEFVVMSYEDLLADWTFECGTVGYPEMYGELIDEFQLGYGYEVYEQQDLFESFMGVVVEYESNRV